MGILRAAVPFGLVALLLIGAGPATTASSALAPPPQGTLVDAGSYHPIIPTRVLDTRLDLGGHPRVMRAGETFALQLTGRGGVPAAGVSAVMLNVTAADAGGDGFVAVYPTGQPRPVASALNLAPGASVANAVTARVGDGGRVDLYVEGSSSHLAVDVVGWYDQYRAFTASTGQAGYVPLAQPTRILDTRSPLGGHPGTVPAGGSVAVGLAAAGVPPDATAVQLSVTGTQATAVTFLTVWSTGAPRPVVSTLNLSPGQTAANSATVTVGAGSVSLFNNQGTIHLLLDVQGYFQAMPDASSGQFAPLAAPVRVLDTRGGARPAALSGGQTRSVGVTGVAGVPRGPTRAVALTVTATQPSGATFVSVWPGGARPATSTLNVVPGETRAVLVVVGVGADGAVRLFNDAGAVHLVVDVIGWYTGAAAAPVLQRPALPAASGVSAPLAPLAPPGRGVVGQAQRRSADELAAYWTPARLAAADAEVLTERDTAGTPSGTRFVAPAAAHPSYPVFSQGYLPATEVRHAIGRLYATTPDGTGGLSCSGTVVARNVVLTAAHCVYSLGKGFNNDVIFAPGQRGESFPFGTWQPTAWYVYSQFYTANAGGGFGPLDYALLVFDPDSSGTDIGTRTGYLPVLTESVGGTVTSFGYPAEGWFAGSCAAVACEVWACTSPVSAYSNGGGWYEMGIGCNTAGGASGGPIVARRDGTWYVVSVNSNSSNDTDAAGGSRYYTGNMWGPVLNSWAGDLVAQHARF